MLAGDFNSEESKPFFSQLLLEINAKKIVKEPT